MRQSFSDEGDFSCGITLINDVDMIEFSITASCVNVSSLWAHFLSLDNGDAGDLFFHTQLTGSTCPCALGLSLSSFWYCLIMIMLHFPFSADR